MNYFNRLFSTNTINDIFTPNTVARLTYINRNNIEEDLEKYLELPGKQIILYGHSGSGKTTLLTNKLKDRSVNFIRTHCESGTTFNDLLLQAFDELNRYYVLEKNISSTYTISSEAKAEFKFIGLKIGESNGVSFGTKSERIVPIQLTPQKLARFLGEIDSVWIIEDFHKVSEIEKKRIADVVKIFIDIANEFSKVKIICIGAVGTARELIELDNNLNNRVAELFVPLLTNNEIKSLVGKGFDLLNVKIDSDLKDKIVYYSNNLASITHQICYDICFHSGIKKSRFFTDQLNNNAFKIAVNSYVRKNSDTFTKIFNTIVCQSYGWNVLKTFEFSEKEYLSFNEIKNKIPFKKRPDDEELRSYLNQLGTLEYKEIIRYDKSLQKYSISSPFFSAFLKMKFALEQNEQRDTKNKRRNKRNNKYNIEKITEEKDLLFDDDFFITYNSILDTLLEKQIKLNSKILEINQ